MIHSASMKKTVSIQQINNDYAKAKDLKNLGAKFNAFVEKDFKPLRNDVKGLRKEFNEYVGFASKNLATKKELGAIGLSMKSGFARVDAKTDQLRREVMTGMDKIMKKLDDVLVESKMQYGMLMRHDGWVKGLAHHTEYKLEK